MFAAIGIVILLVMVFGGFAITGGALGPVMEAIPHEMLIIGGAAIGRAGHRQFDAGAEGARRRRRQGLQGPQAQEAGPYRRDRRWPPS